MTSLQNPTQEQATNQKRKPKCRYFGTARGCRAGDACQFRHETLNEEPHTAESHHTQAARQPLAAVDSSKTVQRPIAPKEVQDPRTFQINQIKRRFSAQMQELDNGDANLLFKMAPSDPDFPFDIDSLECTLWIPRNFPKEKSPSLRISNEALERGYQINVEQGFDAIWAQSQNPTLLNAFKTLDKQLEAILTAKKAEIVKIVANARPATSQPEQRSVEERTAEMKLIEDEAKEEGKIDPTPTSSMPKPTPERIAQARARREAELQILEHRLGRDPQFRKVSEETYTIPIEPRKKKDLPPSLQALKSVSLFVPLAYDLEPSTIRLLGVEGESATNVAAAFEQRNLRNPDPSLLAQINYLAQNMHTMALQNNQPQLTISPPEDQENNQRDESRTQQEDSQHGLESDLETERTAKSHIHIIPRPPEWSTAPSVEDDDFSQTSEDSEDMSDEDSNEDAGEDVAGKETGVTSTSSTPREKGILISFPHLELHGIELLELVTVNITVRCQRCKDTMDVTNIRNNEKGDYTGLRSESCKKCAMAFSIGYRKDLLHTSSIRAGYLDLDGCTVADLLPSNFTPTCSECSTTYPANPGVVSVRGDSSMAICRECHRKMVFRIPEIKFLQVGEAAAVRAQRGLPLKKKKKEDLGIVAGQELPKRGRCSHYRRSNRWFRFSCCNKVFACDRCHDLESDHPQEFANRMICGFCSREQNYRPENCGICHSMLTGRATSGFWEGGKGTRDKARMSRKDPRKYKRRGGGAVANTK